MAMYEKQLTIDISGEGPYKHITAKQGDKKSRFYRITLVDCGKKISLTEKEKVDFRCTKPDENYCIIPTTKNADGTVSFELDEQILAVVGVVVSEFVITDDNGMILSTTVFYIHVLPSALSGYYIPSQSLQIMDRNLDMSGYDIRNLPIPNENGDAVNKGYVDEQLKNVKVPIDSTLDENSTNAIQNAVVAREFKKVEKNYRTEFDVADLNGRAITVINKNNQNISFYPFNFTVFKSDYLINEKCQLIFKFDFVSNFTNLETSEKHIIFSNTPEDVKNIADTYFIVFYEGEYQQFCFENIVELFRDVLPEDDVVEYSISYSTLKNSVGDNTIEYTSRKEEIYIETTDVVTLEAIMEQISPLLENLTKIAIEFKEINIETKEGELIYG